MSYSISFIVKDEKGINFNLDDFCEFDLNITYNVRRMFQACFQNEDGIKILDEMNVVEAKERIKDAVMEMIDYREQMIKIEPENGWGSYNGTVQFLVEFALNCQQLIETRYDDATIYIC